MRYPSLTPKRLYMDLYSKGASKYYISRPEGWGVRGWLTRGRGGGATRKGRKREEKGEEGGRREREEGREKEKEGREGRGD